MMSGRRVRAVVRGVVGGPLDFLYIKRTEGSSQDRSEEIRGGWFGAKVIFVCSWGRSRLDRNGGGEVVR